MDENKICFEVTTEGVNDGVASKLNADPLELDFTPSWAAGHQQDEQADLKITHVMQVKASGYPTMN